eukprot:COSAG02_NODE_280_length_25797_cov_66.644447_17_plen_273_part_00
MWGEVADATAGVADSEWDGLSGARLRVRAGGLGMASAEEELAKLRAENEALRAENAALRGESGEGVTLDGLAATLRDFVERTDHALHHQGVDEIADEVQALKDAEENLSPEEISQAREMFDRYDVDGSGAIDTDELAMLMLALGETIPQEKLAKMVQVDVRSDSSALPLINRPYASNAAALSCLVLSTPLGVNTETGARRKQQWSYRFHGVLAASGDSCWRETGNKQYQEGEARPGFVLRSVCADAVDKERRRRDQWRRHRAIDPPDPSACA